MDKDNEQNNCSCGCNDTPADVEAVVVETATIGTDTAQDAQACNDAAYVSPAPADLRVKKQGSPTATLTLGILSLFAATTGLGGIIAVILGIIGVIQGHEAKASHPDDSAAKTGFILSIIGLVAGALVCLLCIAVLCGIAVFAHEAVDIFDSMIRYGYLYW